MSAFHILVGLFAVGLLLAFIRLEARLRRHGALMENAGSSRAKPTVEAAGPDSGGLDEDSRYVFVDDDGSARELEPDEIEALNAKYSGGDGNRPYVKSSYDQLTPDNRLLGYLLRDKLPATVRVKPLSEAVPVRTEDEAIRIAKAELPISFCIKSGTSMGRIVDPRSGRVDFGVPGVDVASGSFSAALHDGVWRVIRTPQPDAMDVEQVCFTYISARSGRVMYFGWS